MPGHGTAIRGYGPIGEELGSSRRERRRTPYVLDSNNQSISAGLSSVKLTAAKTARGASAAIGGMTARMVKGATAGNLIVGTTNRVAERTRNRTIRAAQIAARESSMGACGRALAKAHDVATDAFQNAVEAVRKVGYHGEEVVHSAEFGNARAFRSAGLPKPTFGK